MNRRTVAWLGVGCGVVCIATVVVTLIAGGAFVRWAMEEPENINIHVDVPIQATKNDSLVIEVRVENTATESQSLDSIDISSEYLEGIVIEGSEPPFTESFLLPIIDQQSYTFEREIPPEVNREIMQQFHRRHYEKFLDDGIPMLDNMTPRQAAASPEMRPRLIELMKLHLHGIEQRSRDEGFALDLNWVLDELGLDELR